MQIHTLNHFMLEKRKRVAHYQPVVQRFYGIKGRKQDHNMLLWSCLRPFSYWVRLQKTVKDKASSCH